MNKWQLQEAKNKLSEVVNKAINRGPQIITRRGTDTVVILSMKEYKKLKKPRTNFVEFLRKSPLVGMELDLERNKDIAREVEI